MPSRDIIQIDEELCDGCGDCVVACEEGAIKVIDGKARLISDVYCDGFGACLGECPQGAITIIQRDAAEYDEKAVQKHLAGQAEERPAPAKHLPVAHGCPGSAMRDLSSETPRQAVNAQPQIPSQLGHWPVQLMLVPPHAPFLQGADLLICADCVPFAVPDFHQRYLTNRAVLVGCPKLDDLPHYREKIAAIFAQARPRRVTTLIMEVPCCHGLAQAVFQARNSVIPETELEVHTIGIRGGITEESVPANAKQKTSAFNMAG
jgi:Fe-S-cluster-containing hydrogenase component 2